MSKILLTGCASFIGPHALDRFLADGPQEEVFAPMSATITLEDEMDMSRGDMLVKANNQSEPTQDIDAMICWFDSSPLAGRGKYILRHTTKEVKALVIKICYKVYINTLRKVKGELTFNLNDIGRIKVRTSAPLIADSYKSGRISGSFVLIDELTNATVAAGMII